jgi:ATP-dependent Lon protease
LLDTQKILMTKDSKNNMSNHKIHTIDNLSLQEYDSEAELIPLLTPEDEEEMINEELPDSPPNYRWNMVLFPGVVTITAGRDKSIVDK